MITNLVTRRISTALAMAAVSLAALAPAAHAGHANGHDKWRGSESRSSGHTRVEFREHSSVGPALAGLVGGLVLGAVIGSHSAHAQERVVYRDRYVDDGGDGYSQDSQDSYGGDPGYDDGNYFAGAPDGYYDPDSGVRYSTLDACGAQLRQSRHPAVVYVIQVRSGQCIDRFGYSNGGWRRYGMSGGYAIRGRWDSGSDRTWNRNDRGNRDDRDDRRYRGDDRRDDGRGDREGNE